MIQFKRFIMAFYVRLDVQNVVKAWNKMNRVVIKQTQHRQNLPEIWISLKLR